MFKAVPYFCYSHLLALIQVTNQTLQPNPPVFNEALVPQPPLPLERVLSDADIAEARRLIALVSPRQRIHKA